MNPDFLPPSPSDPLPFFKTFFCVCDICSFLVSSGLKFELCFVRKELRSNGPLFESSRSNQVMLKSLTMQFFVSSGLKFELCFVRMEFCSNGPLFEFSRSNQVMLK